MSVDKLVDSIALDSDLGNIANAIRFKGGTTAPLQFPTDFINAIYALRVFHDYTGSLITFNSVGGTTLTKVLVSMSPQQSGSGYPAPDNIRPITGYSQVELFQSGEDTSDYTSTVITFPTPPSTVYGGALNITTGELIVNYAYGRVQTMTGISTGTYPFVWGSTASMGIPVTVSSASLLCNTLRPRTNIYDTVELGYSSYVAPNGVIRLRLPGITTVADANTWLSNNPTYFCYEIAPTTYNITAVQINSISGENNIWCDAGNLTVEYIE